MDDASPSSYLATTTTSSRIDPDFLRSGSSSTTFRSNSQSRLLSPTPLQTPYSNGTTAANSSSSRRLMRNYSLDNDPSALRLDNFVTLRRRRNNETPPMLLSPSATRQLLANSSNTSSRDGSVTPTASRYSHSCSNASIASNNTES